MASRHRYFGRIRKLPSGRYQVRYTGPDGVLRPAPDTFERKRQAEKWLADKQTELTRGEWIDPDAGKVTVREYGESWIRERPGLRPRTVTLYNGLLRNHIAPALGDLSLSDLKTARIRQWRRERLDDGVGEVTVAKAYRLLHAILETAVDPDRLIARNPCRIPGAGQEHSDERPTATVEQVFIIADAIPRRYRLLVLLACFGSLRWGEITGLAREHVDIDGCRVYVRRAVSELTDGSLLFGKPKSAAGLRSVALPSVIMEEVKAHLDEFVGSARHALLFATANGAPIRRSNFQDYWRPALKAAGLSELHIHDLRHTGNTWASEMGASLRELMSRMGHSSTRAALIYIHQRDGRDQAIAAGIDAMITRDRRPAGSPRPTQESDEQEAASG